MFVLCAARLIADMIPLSSLGKLAVLATAGALALNLAANGKNSVLVENNVLLCHWCSIPGWWKRGGVSVNAEAQRANKRPLSFANPELKSNSTWRKRGEIQLTRCYCIFEGGGAKGIAHIGALRALEDAKLDFAGFAGTSAGAIVAALAAAGYSSREMFSDAGSILDIIDGDRSNIWSGTAFHPLKTPPRLLGGLGWTSVRCLGHLPRIIPFVAVPLVLVASGLPYWVGILGPSKMIGSQAILVLTLILLPFLLVYPMASLRPMAFAINQALSLKIRRNRSANPVTFADLRAAGCPNLKIVATDISSRSLALFSADTTPDVAVGDAVAASACIPIVFRAHEVDGRLCYDGGLVSNLPAWSFDSERSVDRDSWTAVVEIGEAAADAASGPYSGIANRLATCIFGKIQPRGLGILSATVNTAVFGAGILNTRNVDRLRNQPLSVDLGLLEFDVSRSRANTIIESAQRESRANIVYQLSDLPALIEDMCERLRGQILGLINIARTSEGHGRFEGRLRIALFFPSRDDPHTLFSEFNHGFQHDADERLRVPVASSFVGRAWREQEGYYIDHNDQKEWESYLARPEDRWVRKLRWDALSWLIAVPYYHVASDDKIVVAVDSDLPLEVSEREPLLTSIFQQIETMLELNLPLEAFALLK